MSMRQDVIDRLEREDTNPTADRKWAEVCERAGYRCEYCDRDMLASLDNYLLKVQDHIIPQSAGGSNTVGNIALSCYNCNSRKLKGNWNPADEAGEDASRDELIQAVRRYLRKRRGSKYKEYLNYQEIVGYPSSHQQCGCCE